MLKLQCFSHRMPRADSLEKTLMLGKIEDKRRRGPQRMRLLDSITDSVMNLSMLQEIVEGQGSLECCSSCGDRVGHDLVSEQQQQTACWITGDMLFKLLGCCKDEISLCR